MIKTYDKKPDQVRAIQWDVGLRTFAEIRKNTTFKHLEINKNILTIAVDENSIGLTLKIGDWLVFGEESTLLRYSNEDFRKKYQV